MSDQISDGGGSNQNQDDVLLYKSPFLADGVEENNPKMALVVLNTPIRQPPSPLFQYLWKKASFRICADGGANRLYHASRQGQQAATSNIDHDEEKVEEYLPDVIRGDLDSLLPAVSDYYQSRGTRIEQDPDQDTNDLDKALQAVLSWSTPPYRVYVYGAFGGRFDQEMASIQALYKWRETFHNQIFLYDDHTCAYLLAPGQENRIQCRYYGEGRRSSDGEEPSDGSGGESSRLGEGPTCGLIPISGRCEFVTTTGFKWNLEGDSLEFGGLVSTSNRVMESTVTVRTSHPLVFTAEVWPGDEQFF